jgi:hypothetical protein
LATSASTSMVMLAVAMRTLRYKSHLFAESPTPATILFYSGRSDLPTSPVRADRWRLVRGSNTEPIVRASADGRRSPRAVRRGSEGLATGITERNGRHRPHSRHRRSYISASCAACAASAKCARRVGRLYPISGIGRLVQDSR